MEENYQRALEPSFTYGYGCCVFKHDICGDQPKVPDCMPGGNQPEVSNCMSDSLNFLSPEHLASLRCPPASATSEDTATRVHRREVAEEPERGVVVGDLSGTS